MKRKPFLFGLVLMLAASLTGCGFWSVGAKYYVKKGEKEGAIDECVDRAVAAMRQSSTQSALDHCMLEHGYIMADESSLDADD